MCRIARTDHARAPISRASFSAEGKIGHGRARRARRLQRGLRMKSISRAALGLLLSVAAFGCETTPYGVNARSASRARVGVTSLTAASVITETGLQDRMREMFLDRAAWTRLYAVALWSKSPDANVTRARLMRTDAEIGGVFARFYGRAAGDRLTRMLDDGLDWQAAAVRGAMAGDHARVAEARHGWFIDSSRLATWLATLNPAFSQAGLSIALRTIAAEAVNQANGAGDAEAMVGQNLALADIFAGGIAEQFPRKVAGPALDPRAQSVRVVLRDAFAVRGMLLHEYVVAPSVGARERVAASGSAVVRPLGFFYGAALATELGEIMQRDARDATATIDAALSGDESALDAARNAWGVDADRFAILLSRANSRFDRNTIDRALRDAIAAAVTDARRRRDANWVTGADAADVLRGRMARVGDVISGPTISQFAL